MLTDYFSSAFYFERGRRMGPFESAQMNDYFSTLPPTVQQSILQSAVQPTTLAQLQSLAGKMSDCRFWG